MTDFDKLQRIDTYLQEVAIQLTRQWVQGDDSIGSQLVAYNDASNLLVAIYHSEIEALDGI